MTFEKIVATLQKTYKNATAENIKGKLAVEVDVRGEGEGALYIEVNEGKVDVQPFEYYDKNATIITSGDAIVAIASGKMDIETAVNDGTVTVDGDLGSALLLKEIKLAAKKAAAKKTPAKKAEAVKEEAPKAEKKAPAKKAVAKKAEAVKEEATKAEKKVVAKKAPAKKTEAVKEEAPKAEKKAPAKKAAAKKTK